MKKILCVVGNRPQFIKHAPTHQSLSKHFTVSTLHTGQHSDIEMSEVFFEQLHLPKPDYFLELSKGLTQGEQTANMLVFIEKILSQNSVDAVLVYGDTNSTLAATLAAAKLNLPIAHIEAGMRSFNKSMPEEQNRIIADHLSTWRFCNDKYAIQLLENEGLTDNNFVVGDVMYDALQMVKPNLKRLFDGKYYFATLHRPYNVDEKFRLSQLLDILNKLNLRVVFALHPRTKRKMEDFGLLKTNYLNIYFIEPQGYTENLSYQLYAEHVITDSGGMQKEAYWLERPCTTVRSETEWTETLKNSCNQLVFNDLENLQQILSRKIENFDNLFGGNGKAADKIAELLDLLLKKSNL